MTKTTTVYSRSGIQGWVIVICTLALVAPALAGPEKIVSLAPNVTEVLYDLGLGDRIVAVTSFCDYPPAAKDKPKIGGMSNPSLEAIVALKPDMVVLSDDGSPRETALRLHKLGVPCHVFQARRIRELPGGIIALGAALDVKKQADRRAARIEQGIARYTRKASSYRTRRPVSVLFVVQPTPLMAAGSGTSIDDIFQILGMENIAASAGKRYPHLSVEEILRRSPDILFIARVHGQVPAEIRRLLAKLENLDAVRKGRVHFIGDSPLRLGPRILDGIAEIAAHAAIGD